MPSFDTVNYSLRPNKSIQRQIIFDGIRRIHAETDLHDPVYIGLGSIWFSDFVMAHKILEIHDMISIEQDPVGYSRARFNRPYATVKVMHGTTSGVLPLLFKDSTINTRPWVLWLDYDGPFDETARDDLIAVVENAPPNSVFLLTFPSGGGYGFRARDRAKTLRAVFGEVTPTRLDPSWCHKDRMQTTLADLTTDLLLSAAHDSARPGRFLPAFRIIYRDTSPMVTVGGILPHPQLRDSMRKTVSDPTWRCWLKRQIEAPHLTMLETMTIQAHLPRNISLTESDIHRMGFDLPQQQIEAFEKYYKEYPTYREIVA